MGDRHDYVALDWVKGEISETLNQARQALEAFVENPGDSTRLRFCLTYIHQVHGTLQMVEFYGAALLAEEMEKLAQALMHGSASREGEALDVLMQAILQLPILIGYRPAAVTCRWCCCPCLTTCVPPGATSSCRKLRSSARMWIPVSRSTPANA